MNFVFHRHSYKRIDIFGANPLNIFTKEEGEEKPKPPVLHTWNYFYERDLRLSVTHPPGNIFEQMILWTEQGKIWKFPIDNEQGKFWIEGPTYFKGPYGET